VRRTATAPLLGTFWQPQPAVVQLASEGGFAGAVLDAACGTGENALHVASLGLQVLGVDVAETALTIAREKAEGRGLEVEFVLADALQLARLGRMFQTVLDCGLLYTFDSDERRGYAASLASVTDRGGTLYVLCFSDIGPGTCGPASHQSGRATSGVQPQQRLGCHRHRTDPASNQVPGRRRTGLVGDDQTDLDRETGSGRYAIRIAAIEQHPQASSGDIDVSRQGKSWRSSARPTATRLTPSGRTSATTTQTDTCSQHNPRKSQGRPTENHGLKAHRGPAAVPTAIRDVRLATRTPRGPTWRRP
jgi:hypothetical protein